METTDILDILQQLCRQGWLVNYDNQAFYDLTLEFYQQFSQIPHPAKILLVEDNEMNRDMLERRLSRKGYEVLIAVDGAEGVELSRSHQPDIILMDMSLPVMDGWSATREIKNYPKTNTIPVIALTAHAMAGDREKSIAAGCDDYDTKPIEFTRLLEKIETLLKKTATP
jgi:CheY-like chemotaxis protein